MKLKHAVLVIHGFAGGIYDEQSIIDELQLYWKLDVFSYTLPGHERNLSKVKFEDWITASEEKVNWLIAHGYSSIYVLGHSMGGVIASYLTTKYKEIKKVVLAAPSFYYLKVDENKLSIVKNIKEYPKILKTYSFQEVFARLLKLNISGVSEFTKLVKKYHSTPKDIKVPIMIIQGKNDSIVPMKSSKYVYDFSKSKVKRLVLVSDVTHDIFNSKRSNEINDLVKDFLIHNKFNRKVIEI